MTEEILPIIMPYLIKATYAIGFFLVGIMIAKISTGRIARNMIKKSPNPSTKKMAQVIGSMIMSGATVALALTSVTILGVDVTLIMGGMGLVIGYAMEEVLGNIFASLMIVTHKNYHIGDTVKIGGDINILGTIEKVTARTTTVITYDKQRIIIPNMAMMKSPVTPYSKSQLVRCTSTIHVERSVDISPIKKLIVNLINKHPATTANEYTVVLLSGYSESGKDLVCYYYHNPSNEAGVGRLKYVSEINQKIHQALKRIGVTFPIPQRTIDTSKITQ